ncbi:hypothetical protein [Sphingomonas crocodyli]|uniref:Extradiol ring-cleavage dioxygenase class III enzyme subunit B domain-containing protein n=1 Tax=Sphingomonas crocodyli TaxID=1979270 RepID=A0A437M5N0_9SPHN|nr:hypothetical protein [Sphingomonas crocodyli]RVT92949.1 hypothetical protein EOD43_03310 [Sphingomonas crocodyli]
MAKIVLGVGSSHSPILLMEPKAWLERGAVDDKTRFTLFDNDGEQIKYADLLAKAPPQTEAELDPVLMQQRHEANEAGIRAVAKALSDADPDVIIAIGDDQREVFHDENMPALSVYWGETLPYLPQGIMKWKYADELRSEKWYPQEALNFPVNAKLAERLIGDLCEMGFDPSHSKFYPEGQGMSHSFGYIYHRLMIEKVWPLIPISINAYYPPNQISPLRAFDIGEAIRRAVKSWPEDIRVAVVATGGLSHFVVDEQLDNMFLDILREGGRESHATLPRKRLQSGNSELRCWSMLAGAVDGMTFDLIDYVPCYRTPAGTGCGIAFATWR